MEATFQLGTKTFEFVQPKYVTQFVVNEPQGPRLWVVAYYYLDPAKLAVKKYHDFSTVDGNLANFQDHGAPRTYNQNPNYNYYVSFQPENRTYGFIAEEV